MIDPSEVQSLIIRPRSPAAMRLTFVRFAAAGHLARLLQLAAAEVTFAADVDVDRTRPTRHLGITGAGLLRLRVGDRAVAALPRPFLEGMRRGSHRLGDFDESDPSAWVAPFAPDDPPVDVVVIDSAPDHRLGGEVVWPASEAIDQLVADHATTVVWEGAHLGGYEHFGFRDGISDPVIDGSGRRVTPGNGVWDPVAGRWRAVAAGEALLGHVDERGVVAGHVAASAIERDGSYLVIRRLQQHVERFRHACTAIGDGLTPPLTGDEVAAQLVGRSRDGTPLGLDGDDPNDFRYRGPKVALRVPPSSHIRRANPRDDIEAAALMVPRHQLFRRGIPYGPPLDESVDGAPARRVDGGLGEEPDERGLLFLAACADIARQFEFVQGHWLQDGNRFGLGAEPDALTGNRSRPGLLSDDARSRVSVMRADGSRATVSDLPHPDAPDDVARRCPISSFVTTRGGEYVLLPSRAALAYLGSLGAR